MVKISKPLLVNKTLIKVMEILLVLFGLYLVIQILRKIVGASWSIEDVILGLLLFNIGCTFTIAIILSQLKSDHNHLKNQFKSLASDFKEHIGKK